jgi:hypothetical protein
MSAVETVPAEQRPRGTPAAAPVAIVIAVCLLAAGLVAGRELLIVRDVIDETPWVANTFGWISRLTWQTWMLAPAVAAVVLGVLALFAALKPRAHTHVGTATPPSLWLTTTDTARASTAAALHVEGVMRAHTTAGRRRVTVHIVGAENSPGVLESVRHRVDRTLADLDPRPEVRVTLERTGGR